MRWIRRKVPKQASVGRELGVGHSDGVTVYFSLSPNESFGFLCSQLAPDADTPMEVNVEIETRRSTHEMRKFVVVVEGDLGYLKNYRSKLTGADVVLYVASEDILNELGVQIVDAGWTEDKGPLPSLEGIISNRRLTFDQAEVEEGPAPGDPTEASADSHGFPQDPMDVAVRPAPIDELAMRTQRQAMTWRSDISLHVKLAYDDQRMSEHEAQQTFLQGFPDRIGGVVVDFVEITAGLVTVDGVSDGPRFASASEPVPPPPPAPRPPAVTKLWQGVRLGWMSEADATALDDERIWHLVSKRLRDPIGSYWTRDATSAAQFSMGASPLGHHDSQRQRPGGQVHLGIVLVAEVPRSVLRTASASARWFEREVDLTGALLHIVSAQVTAWTPEGSDVWDLAWDARRVAVKIPSLFAHRSPKIARDGSPIPAPVPSPKPERPKVRKRPETPRVEVRAATPPPSPPKPEETPKEASPSQSDLPSPAAIAAMMGEEFVPGAGEVPEIPDIPDGEVVATTTLEPGMAVREETGIEGLLLSVEGTLATVKFADSDEEATVPLSTLMSASEATEGTEDALPTGRDIDVDDAVFI